MRRFLFLVPVAFFVGFAVLLYVGLRAGPPQSLPSVLIGQPVPEFPMASLNEDVEPFGPDAFGQGRPAIVNFWASWCAPCRIEAPVLQSLSERSDLTVYGIAYKDDAQDARAFLVEFGDPFDKINSDFDGRAAIDWGVSGVPETFVIDADGIVRARYAGALTEEVVRQLILPAAGL